MFEKFAKKLKELEQETVKLNDEMLKLSNDTVAISEEIIDLEHDISEYEDTFLKSILDMPFAYSNEQSRKLAFRRILREDQDYIRIRDKILERKKALHQNKNLIIHKEYLIQMKLTLLSRFSI